MADPETLPVAPPAKDIPPGVALIIGFDAWIAEGKQRFGEDLADWAFSCPSCGHVATRRDFAEVGAPTKAPGRACLGCFLPSDSPRFTLLRGPCTYGSAQPSDAPLLHPVLVLHPEGPTFRMFSFAPGKP
jgi:hypothetical protein